MKQFILSVIFAVLSIGLVAPEAEAKRLGGGSSIGMQRQAKPPAAAPQQNMNRQQAATPPAQTPKRSWMGPLAGLAAGLGLAALFSHLGLGEELASFVMIALLAVATIVVFRLLFRRKTDTQAQPMQYAGAAAGNAGSAPYAPAPMTGPAAGGSASAIPADFDAAGFARQAKLNFIRLQAANDTANLDDIREFTTPEMYAELSMQLRERGNATQRTDVVELNADVLDVEEEANRYIVSVRFNGLLREEEGAAPTAFDEIWHLTKARNGNGGWLVAGIQQAS